MPGPCIGDHQKTIEHDALVMKIVAWLVGDPDVDLPDPSSAPMPS
jgi:hypothetical protein